MRLIKRILTLTISIAILITGCNGNKSKPQNLPDAHSVIEQGAQQLQNAQSFSLEMQVSGYPVEIQLQGVEFPSDTPLLFKYAKGVFEAPDRIDASIQFGVGDVSTTAELIALDGEHYFRSDLLTANQWIKGELIPGYSPASLLSETGGVAHALNAITDLQMVGKEDLEGLNVFHLRGSIQAGDVHTLTFGLIRTQSGTIKIEVYVEVDNQRIAQISISDPPPTDANSSEPTIWQINFTAYNQDVSITPPATPESN
jgi:hypothetical protein